MSFIFPNSSVAYTFILFSLVLALVYFGLRLVNYTYVFNSIVANNTPTTPSSVYIQGRQQQESIISTPPPMQLSSPNDNNGFFNNDNRVIIFFKSLSSSSRSNVRSFHHRLASVVFVVLLFMATTGASYRFLRNVVGMEKSQVKWIIKLHSMKFLPAWLSFIWVSLVFSVLAILFYSGVRLIIKTRRRSSPCTPSRNASSNISRRRLRNNNNNNGESNQGTPIMSGDDVISNVQSNTFVFVDTNNINNNNNNNNNNQISIDDNI
ncbi:hypothetical protein DFA_06014 [Cavenderia fasciculata]|uniref:Uncharacterized protein n=1 Tax=Cavenderia fasciculata TaxID=261658 RepID=F4PJV2_CACFS|nr:uncharacterized protein DFA_06014 [Cavenderia fasciculata]EGG23876.1 hypothetical protein DFA_06014 [Cavenderia fasciculata]|eukprot:XP_004361727.1 hypothetical protein DFA_06014 [Cavenderia fasciculata]